MNITTKLVMAFFEVTLLVLLIGFLGLGNIGQIRDRFDVIAEDTAPALVVLSRIKTGAMKVSLEALSLPFLEEKGGSTKERVEAIDEARKGLQSGAEEFGRLADDPVEKRFASDIASTGESLYAAASRLVDLTRQGAGPDEVEKGRLALNKEQEVFLKLLDRAVAYESEVLKNEHREAHQAVTRSRRFIFLSSIVGLLVATVVGYLMARQIAKPLSGLSQVTKQIKEGDLSQRVEVRSKDEIGELSQSFNDMAEAIQMKNKELLLTNEELREATRKVRETHEKLLQQEKLAAVGQLASGVGHELRNPLGVLKNSVYYLRTKLGETDEKVVKYLALMDREIETSNKIINDLLGFSRTKKPTLLPHPVNDVVKEALSTIAVPTNVKLVEELDASLPNAMMDQGQIRQVFINMILNGIQAMSGRQGILTIRTRKERDFIEAEFRDTGCGIPKENLRRLFDPFFTTKSAGIGLGLAVSRGIVERHRGGIEVTSEVGKGTTFVVKLPMVEGREVAA